MFTFYKYLSNYIHSFLDVESTRIVDIECNSCLIRVDDKNSLLTALDSSAA